MNIKKAKIMFDELIDLCYQLDDKILSESIVSFYKEVADAEDECEVLQITSELMFYVDEVFAYDQDAEETKAEIQSLYNKMQDEIE